MFLSPLLAQSGAQSGDQSGVHPGAPWILINGRTLRPLARSIETAFDSKSRNKGLLGRRELTPDSALILAPCSSIHTFFMQFPIDVLFVNRQGVVLRTVHAMPPWRIALALRAFAVVELPAGVLKATDTRRQDLLELARG